LRSEFFALMGQVESNDYEPWLIVNDEDKPYDFSYTRIKQYDGAYRTKRAKCFSSMLDEFFTRSAQERRIRQRSAATLKSMSTARDRLIRKMASQKHELEETSKRDYLRECGDIITANMHLLKKGQQSFIAEDFYAGGAEMREIKLDPLKTPQQNAASYYKAYTKAKNARGSLAAQLQRGEAELVYIESVIEQIQRVENEQDLNEVRDELELTGYIRAQRQQKKKQAESSALRFLSTTGMKVFAGRNNMQNDKLTLKTASKSDIWLHAQKIHGAHVIISCEGAAPDEKTLHEAASIAAYYSAARADAKVPVDYTHVKNVKKLPGGRPGMVIYTDYKTIIAAPDEELLRRCTC
jgi:predicted ribosome quality control (RQC) complex YloA/Tae2 family protein